MGGNSLRYVWLVLFALVCVFSFPVEASAGPLRRGVRAAARKTCAGGHCAAQAVRKVLPPYRR